MSETANVTLLLRNLRDGDKAALDALTPILYQELRRLAESYLRRERSDHTLQATALIHEAYLRMVDQSLPDFESRRHFFAVAAQLMRQVLVDCARRHRAAKRGDGRKVQLDDEAMAVAADEPQRLLEIDQAIGRLAAQDDRKAKVIELRYFAGLTREEVAETMGLTLATVKRDLSLAEAFLRRELAGARA